MGEIRIVYTGREGRRTPQGYKVRFLVQTSDGREFWSHVNAKEAKRQALDHCAGK